MRLLNPMRTGMSGPEVEAWQRFLCSKRLYHGPIDGYFDRAVAAATQEYQMESGLKADGVVGSETIEQALRDGFSPPGDSGDPHYVATLDVVLSLQARAALRKIGDEYYRETGGVLYVTSGARMPETQAEAMYDNLYNRRNLGTRYRDQKAYDEIVAAYNEGHRSVASGMRRLER